MPIRNHHDSPDWRYAAAMLLRLACALLLWCVASNAHAASVYQCSGVHGETVFRDTPCAAHVEQVKREVAGLPLIDHGAPRWPDSAHASASSRKHARTRQTPAARKRRDEQATSWECRAADGEVFYRHTRCPGSVPGDGVVRSAYVEKYSGGRTRARHDAWTRVPVHGTKIPRAEACRRIRSPSAAGRDGHARDQAVDTYAKLTGHDPCRGA